MKQLERNVLQSFDKVKDDIALLRDAVIVLRKMNDKLSDRIDRMEKPKRASAKKVAKFDRKVKFVASRKGEKYHKENCPFTRSIKHPISFSKKPVGYKACVCIC